MTVVFIIIALIVFLHMDMYLLSPNAIHYFFFDKGYEA